MPNHIWQDMLFLLVKSSKIRYSKIRKKSLRTYTAPQNPNTDTHVALCIDCYRQTITHKQVLSICENIIDGARNLGEMFLSEKSPCLRFLNHTGIVIGLSNIYLMGSSGKGREVAAILGYFWLCGATLWIFEERKTPILMELPVLPYVALACPRLIFGIMPLRTDDR